MHADDPSLVRHDETHRADSHGLDAPPPARVVVDSRCRTPADAAILEGPPETYVLTSESAPDERRRVLERSGATLLVAGEERVDLPAALTALAGEGVDHLLVEGGGELIFSLFEAGLVDELSVFVGGMVIGGREAPTLADGEGFVADFSALKLESVERLDDGVLLRWTIA